MFSLSQARFIRKLALRITQGIAVTISIICFGYVEITLAQILPENPKLGDLDPNPNPLYLPTKPEEIKILKTQGISLAQAIALAERNNRDLQIVQLTLSRSQAALTQAQAANLPNIALTGQLSSDRAATESFTDQRKGEIRESVNALSNGVELSYDLFTGGKREVLITTAQRQLESDRLEVQRLSTQVRLDVTNAYFDAQEATEQVRISASHLNFPN